MIVRQRFLTGLIVGLLAAVLTTIAVPPQRNARTRAVAPQKVDLGAIPGEKTVVRDQLLIRRLNDSVKDTVLAPKEYIVARWADRPEKIEPVSVREGDAWRAGFGFLAVDREGREIRFRPVIEASGGLALTGNGNSFQGRVYVGLLDNKDPTASYKLPQPVSLLVSAQAEELMPRQLTIDHTNLPFAEVTIASADPADPMDLSLIAAGTSERATIQLPVIRPRVELLLVRSRIQGLGLETSVISVRAVGVPDPGGRVVIVTSDFASVDPTQVRLDAQGVGTTTVRSVSFGKASINAASPPLAPATVDIQFSWPIAFLLASVIGGLTGAALSLLQKGGKKRDLRTVLIRGVLTGILMVALYGIGVNLLPIHPTATAGEALAFAIAAVGGFLGLKVK